MTMGVTLDCTMSVGVGDKEWQIDFETELPSQSVADFVKECLETMAHTFETNESIYAEVSFENYFQMIIAAFHRTRMRSTDKLRITFDENKKLFYRNGVLVLPNPARDTNKLLVKSK